MIHKLAFLQLAAERRRLVAALAGIAFAVLLQLVQFGFRDALFASSTLLHTHLDGDLVLVSSQYRYVALTGTVTQRRLYQALGVPEVQSVSYLYVTPVTFKNPVTREDRQIFALAFDPDKPPIHAPGLLENAERIKIPDVVLFDALSHRDFGPVADHVRRDKVVTTEIEGRRARIEGLFVLGVSFAATGHIVMSDVTYRRMTGRPDGVFDLGVIRLRPGTDIAAARAALTARLPPDVKVFTHQQFVDVERAYWDNVSPIGFIFLLGSFIGLVVGAVIVYQILYTDISDHLGEYATLKAMGYSNRHFYSIVLEEALILSVCGFPFGFVLAEVVYRLGRESTHLQLEMTVGRAAAVFALTAGICAVSGAIAMRRLSAADPADVF